MENKKGIQGGIWDDDQDLRALHRSPISEKYGENSGLVLIALSVIIAALIVVIGWIGYIEYKAFALERHQRIEVEALAERAKIERQRLAVERARATEARRTQQAYQASNADAMTRAINDARLQASQICQFWRQQHETNPTERTEAEVAKNCPLG